MKYIADTLCQNKKTGYAVCGDHCLCKRTPAGTLYVLCDGVGSGVYANIAAISCAERLQTLWRSGFSLRAAVETVAASMHRARTEDIPFSAFSAAHILADGGFTAYTYEGPKPILLQGGQASLPAPRYYTATYEVIGETTGRLDYGDALLLCSDGVTQAGMGHGYGMGIGESAVVKLVNQNSALPPEALTQLLAEHCKTVSAGRFEDDTTVALLQCKTARELSLFTGPPSKPAMDQEYVELYKNAVGGRVICGSTTTDIFARELGLEVMHFPPRGGMGNLPEYFMEGADLVTEGAITLSQVCNLLDEPPEQLDGNSSVKQLCVLLHRADVVHLHIGKAVNDAHESTLFKQIGVRVRRSVVETIAEKLRAKGKLVTERYY
ncbi:MAG: serine/threonine-protein phosphatase [Oscillospiraceae bacterium]|jgi:serine/threonine protein phosphatase PrpC|nr:serine/threonine-protein phosphatase [Oscillospiraceae bacterium]